MFLRIAVAALLLAAPSGLARAADLPAKSPAPVAAPAPFFFVNENAIGYHYEFTANNPGAGTTPKNVASFSHFDVWAYGTNFFTVDWLKATNANAPFPAVNPGTPAAPCDRLGTSVCAGYTEIYGLFRSTFGLNQLTNSKSFAVGPLTNVELLVGADLNTDNTTLGSAKRSVQGGLQFDFSTFAKGFLNASIFAYHEWQNDGFAALGTLNPSGKVDFNTTWGVEALYSQPLSFIVPESIPLTFKSFLVVHGPKGNGELNNAGLNRTTEYLTAQTLSLDVGKMFWAKPGMLSVYTTYRWWKNKFGIDPVQPLGSFPFTVESTWIAGVTMAF
ncbi:MAG: hypothetical protein ACXWJW_08165 [Xanthobacteraceae bacterium]